MNMLKNLFLYDADGGNQGGDSSSNEANNNKGDQGNLSDDSKKTDNMIPYDRFKEVNDNYKSVKQELDKLKEQQRKAEEDAKKKQGEYESLYNELKEKHEPLEKQFKQYQETFKKMLKTKLDKVPDDFKDLIPKGNELEQLEWIENAEAKGLFNKDNVKSFGNQGNNPEKNQKKSNKGFIKSLSRF